MRISGADQPSGFQSVRNPQRTLLFLNKETWLHSSCNSANVSDKDRELLSGLKSGFRLRGACGKQTETIRMVLRTVTTDVVLLLLMQALEEKVRKWMVSEERKEAREAK